MPYVNNHGIRIYCEVEGQGPPLVLATGANADLTMWRKTGYVEALKDDFQLILFDARGHGRSDKPHVASAYSPNVAAIMAGDVIAILDDLRISKADYFGYSMGALVGFRLATWHGSRFRSFILGGGSPYRMPDAGVEALQEMIEGYDLLRTAPDAFLRRQERVLGRPLSSGEKKWWSDVDPVMLTLILRSIIDLPPLTDQELSAISVPCLLFCGEFDGWGGGAKESVNHIRQARFVALKGLDHMTAMSRTDLLVLSIKEFLAEVSK